MIKFNKPYLSGKELYYISQAVLNGHTSGNNAFTKKCHKFFKETYGFKHCLLTTSCTDALEMAAILLNIEKGDEVIAPSYTFVSTVNAFILRGATIKFADSYPDSPNMDAGMIESLVTEKTKAIVPVHYAGIACDMDKICKIADTHNLSVVEDAAQGIDSYYKGKALGSIGDLGAFSFHETKNIISGEGGMLIVNNEKYVNRSEIIWEKGTNRTAFYRGEIDKYGWVDIGSSFLPSDIISAFLYAQLENMEDIQDRRKLIWDIYYEELKELEQAEKISLPHIPDYATNNAHMFYIVCSNNDVRTKLTHYLSERNIKAVFHYLSLHKSKYYRDKYTGGELVHADKYTDCLLRLPLYYELDDQEVRDISKHIKDFFKSF